MSLSDLLNKSDKPENLVQVSIQDDELKKALQSARLRLGRERPRIRRGVSFAPHAATFPFCRRMKIGQLAGLVDIYYDKVTPKVQTRLDIGKVLHDTVQNYFWQIGELKGTYECLKCDKHYHDLISPTTCPSGKKTHTLKHLRYKEVLARNEEYSLSGRSDGILVREINEILEIKSLSIKPQKNSNEFQFYFDDLYTKGAKPDHLVQINLYMFMLKIYHGHLFYICGNDGQIKTFKVEYDQSIIQPFLDEILYLKEQAALLKSGQKVTLPPCCSDEKCECHSLISPIL